MPVVKANVFISTVGKKCGLGCQFLKQTVQIDQQGGTIYYCGLFSAPGVNIVLKYTKAKELKRTQECLELTKE